jgi:polyadenylate-binding protein
VVDAERALDTMNFTEINGKPCRIMWSQRDPSLRKTGTGNVYVSNLAPSVDNKGLYDTFSVFGSILSCKVVTDENGNSKGYGYVHFETGEAAQDAIQKFNGTLIDDVEVHVSHFVKKQDRAAQVKWTNLYVKQFPLSWDENKVRELFSACGPIGNAVITRDETGKSKGFGFVNMGDHVSAQKAVNDLHGKVFEEDGVAYTLYVGKAQKKVERERELKLKRDQLNAERVTKYQGMNLYVKNISDSVSDEAFREAFAPFGNITSARIMRDDAKNSRGFGFVCYSTAEEANKAVAEMNSKVIGGKPLVVTFYQRKEIRRVQLAASYAPRFPQGMTPGMPMPPFMGMYMPQGQPGFAGQGQPRGAVPYPYPAAPMAGRGAPAAVPRGAPQFGGRPGNFYGAAMPPYGMPPQGGMPQGGMPQGGMPQGQPMGYKPRAQPGAPFPVPQGPMGGNFPPQGAPQGQNRRPAGPGMPQQPMPAMPAGPARGPMPVGARSMGYPAGAPMPMQQPQVRGNVKFTNQARNQTAPNMMPQGMMPAQPQMQPQMGMPPQKMDFSEALLATADPMAQKNMIGERLYPLIYPHAPEQAGKITGMLLEMDNAELLNLIESPEALMSKIEEALTVLRNHKQTVEA